MAHIIAGVTPGSSDMMVIDNNTGKEYTGLVQEINTDEGWAIIYNDGPVKWDQMVKVEGDFSVIWRDSSVGRTGDP